ncbi:polyadenylate-specific 3'-exoribonuclease AS [uncultured Corynebacterium sp.]|uniref:polyadenylate-specific 3'-exoribonuclease AS n=1 Tax=uncultured Corynebacterium sp. TaxID=159447 RepID=UPI0025ECC847|nr:polyadenylate-specific 3'-exoribonuclease AS [uncultured Corynebacterium sp.]
MRYFYDTEFIEDGRTIDLVSIGVVAEDGREFYAVSSDFNERRAGDWVRRNVLPQLPPRSDPAWMPRSVLRERLYGFLLPDHTPGDRLPASLRPEMWAWLGAYDHVAFAQLWGDMTGLPRELPRFPHELRQLWEDAGRPQLPEEPANAHDALADARFNVVKYRLSVQARDARRR